MSKWIAEFELEDGDRMPEHMDLEYHGVKLDFHCRPIGKTYEDGLNEAWEAARKVVCDNNYNYEELGNIFDTISIDDILSDYTASEVIKKIKKYEETKDEIKLGDEVTDNDGWKGVVTRISPDGEYLIILQKDGTALHWKKESFKKTGRHFPQIEEVLKQLQEDAKDEHEHNNTGTE